MISEQDSRRLSKSIASKDSAGRCSRISHSVLGNRSDSVEYSNLSSNTFTSIVEANRSEIDGATSNTLNMISTPWTTESGYSYSDLSGSRKLSKSSRVSWTNEFTSSFVAKTSTSVASDWHTATERSFSKTNLPVPMFSFLPTRQCRRWKVSPESSCSTDSSWTLRTFTSTSRSSPVYNQPLIRVKYPWSPDTVCSGPDEYPSSLDTLASRKGSRVDITTSLAEEIFYPMNYIRLTHSFDETQVIDWTRTKRIGFPIPSTANLIDAKV